MSLSCYSLSLKYYKMSGYFSGIQKFKEQVKLLHLFVDGVWVLSHVWLFVTPWTVVCQAPLPKGFSRPEYWSGLPCPPPGDLPDSGIESCFLHLYIGKQILDQSSHLRSPLVLYSVQFSRSVVSDSLRPHGLQHARPPCPSFSFILLILNSRRLNIL